MKKEKAGFMDEYYFLENNHLTLGGGDSDCLHVFSLIYRNVLALMIIAIRAWKSKHLGIN